MIDQTPDYDAKIAQVQRRLRKNEEAFEVEKRGYDSYKIVNLEQLIDHDRPFAARLEPEARRGPASRSRKSPRLLRQFSTAATLKRSKQ